MIRFIVVLVGLLIGACAVDPYFHSGRSDVADPSLSSQELVWSRDTAQKLADRPQGGEKCTERFEIPLDSDQGVDVKALIKRLEPK